MSFKVCLNSFKSTCLHSRKDPRDARSRVGIIVKAPILILSSTGSHARRYSSLTATYLTAWGENWVPVWAIIPAWRRWVLPEEGSFLGSQVIPTCTGESHGPILYSPYIYILRKASKTSAMSFLTAACHTGTNMLIIVHDFLKKYLS
jgi:hypothetical protein